MKEKLIIKNFGPIRSIDLDLGKITVLIGDQATGKSTVAKILSICRYFSYIVDDINMPFDFVSNFTRTALLDWGLGGFESYKTYIKYENEDYLVEIKNHFENQNSISIPKAPNLIPEITAKSERFKELLNNYKNLKPKKNKTGFGIYPDWSIPHSFLTTDVKKIMNNPFYFPTERGLQSIFSIGKRGLENLNDRLYEQLAALNVLTSNFKKETEIKPLDIHYKYENGQGKFKGKKDKTYFNLTQGASGYQSSIPIVLAIKYYGEVENRKRTFIVEELEQNLFPKAQKKLVEFLVESIDKHDNQFILPTHSPYILTALSNLIYAHKIGTAENGKYVKNVDEIISKKSWININNLSVYYLSEGKASDMVNVEDYIIDLDDLDSVSSDINIVFDKLIELEMTIEKSNKNDL